MVFFLLQAAVLFCTASDGIPPGRTHTLTARRTASLLLNPGKVIDSVICKNDPSQSYALYIPASGNSAALPILYFFDPHAAGSLPLHKYKALADTYGFILAGSNNSKNGNDWLTTEGIWRHLSEDTRSRLKINTNRIYTVGFSGGAKVASYIALNHPGIKGVIAGGAALPDETPAGDFPFSFTILAGEGDMNLTDLEAISGQLDKTRTPHRIIHFEGKHEWAPEKSMNPAFAGLQLDAMRESLLPKDNNFINRYITNSKARLTLYRQASQLIKAGQECALSISLLDGLTDETTWFKKEAARLAADPRYQQQQKAQKGLLVTEQNTKAGYMEHFREDNTPYWEKTIHDLQIKAATRSGTFAGSSEKAMYQRLLAYLSLAFYSLSNHLINAGQDNEARHFVELYKLADPTNSEAWYFSAILHARQNQAQATESDLEKAAENGFRDLNRLQQQPEFFRLSPPVNIPRIKSKIPIPYR